MQTLKFMSVLSLGLAMTVSSAEACPRGATADAMVNQSYRGVSTVDLGSVLGLMDRRCNDRAVYTVTVTMRDLNESRRRRGDWRRGPNRGDWEAAVLLVNGREVGAPQNIDNPRRGFDRDYVFPVSGRLGREIRSLQLRVYGDVYVGRVTVNMEPGRVAPPPPPRRPEAVFLGTSGLTGIGSRTAVIDVGPRFGFFDGLRFRAKDDAFQIDSIEIYFANRRRDMVRLTGITLREGAEFYYDFDDVSRGRRGRGDGDRMIDRIVITGRQGILWGTRAQLEVYGVR
jgi:hypothetical protein